MSALPIEPVLPGTPAKHAQNPHAIRAMSTEQRDKLRTAQLAYVASDPRWPAHKQKLADAQIARRMTLWPNEIEAAASLRSRGRNWSYIQEEIGVCHDVIRRELQAKGIKTGRVQHDNRGERLRGKGFWR